MSREDFDREQFIADRSAFRAWKEAQRYDHTAADVDNPLDGLFVFLADGYETGTLGVRAVAFLLFARPDLLGGDDYSAIADRLGVTVHVVKHAVRAFREAMPDFKGGYWPARTSRNRLVALAEIRARRRELRTEQIEAEALVRKALARERVEKGQKRSRDHAARKRMVIARRTLAAWGILHAVEVKRWEDMERELRELLDPPRPPPAPLPPLDAFEVARREVLHRRGQLCADET